MSPCIKGTIAIKETLKNNDLHNSFVKIPRE